MSSSWSRTLLIAFSKSVYAMTSMVGSFEKIPGELVLAYVVACVWSIIDFLVAWLTLFN